MVDSYGQLPSFVRKTVQDNLLNAVMNSAPVKNTVNNAQRFGENILADAEQWAQNFMGSHQGSAGGYGSAGSCRDYRMGSRYNYDALVEDYMRSMGSGMGSSSGSGANYGFGISDSSMSLTASCGGLSGAVSLNYGLDFNNIGNSNFVDFSSLKFNGSFKGEQIDAQGTVKYDLGNGSFYYDVSANYNNPEKNITASAYSGYSKKTGVYIGCSFKMTL